MKEKFRLLIVEDEIIIAEDLKRQLESLGYDVLGIFSSGKEALDGIEKLSPDLVLMDIVLKGEMDGIEAAERIYSRFNIPVVYISAYVDEKRLEKAKRSEPFGLILKPFNEQQMNAIIELALYKHGIEKELKESEARYRALFENSLDGVLLTVPDGGILSANPTACQMFGRTEEEICRMGRNGVVDTSDPRLPAALEERTRTGKFKGELTFVRKDGSKFPGEISTAVFKDREGHDRTSMVIHDITERKRVEAALRDSRNMLQTVLDAIPASVFWKDRDLLYLGGNRTWLDAAGLKTTEEAAGKSDYDLPWEKQQADFFREVDRRIMESGIPEYDIVEPYLRADGTQAWAKTNKVPLRDAEDNIIGILGTYEDITERKRAEEALKMERQRLFDILEGMPMMVCLLTQDYHVVFANRAFREMFGESKGRHCYEYCYGKKEPCDFCQSYNVLKTGKPHFWEVRTSDGVIIDVYGFPFTDVDGTNMILEVDVDITERKQAEERLKASLNEKEILLRELHHRVKNNLQIICSLLNLQMNEVENEDIKETLRVTHHRIHSMALVHERLYQTTDLSRIEIEDYIQSLITVVSRAYDSNRLGIAFQVKCQKLHLGIDTAMTCGIIVNELITNALKHAFPSGWEKEKIVTVRFKETKHGDVDLIVQDNGKGIPESVDIKNLKTLGLKLVQVLVEDQLGGKLKIESNGGSKFVMRFKRTSK